jgi:hypothetical protein
MLILKRTTIDCLERRLISKLYMDQSVKIKLDQKKTRCVKIGRVVEQGCCFSPILINLYSKYLTKEALEGFGDFLIRELLILTGKYADDLALLAKEEAMPQGMFERLNETGICYGMEMYV